MNMRETMCLLEGVAQQQVLSLIQKCQLHFGVDNLSSGNCGMFGLAICQYLASHGIQATLAMAFKDPNDEIETIEDILMMETDIYHIVVECQGNLYDGTGLTDLNNLRALTLHQYNDDQSGFYTSISCNDKQMIAVIENETNWSITSGQFLHFLRENEL